MSISGETTAAVADDLVHHEIQLPVITHVSVPTSTSSVPEATAGTVQPTSGRSSRGMYVLK